MKIFVVDASVAVKWFIPEIYYEAALQLRNSEYELHVPKFVLLEIGNVLCKKQRQTELTREESALILKLLQSLPLHWHSDDIIFNQAVTIASETQRSLYDCMYLSLAILLDGLLVTADRKFYEALQNTPYKKYLIWVENL
jgi:predicted nucleic acid-binding protein